MLCDATSEAGVQELEACSAACCEAWSCRAPRGALLFEERELVDCCQRFGRIAYRYHLFEMHASRPVLDAVPVWRSSWLRIRGHGAVDLWGPDSELLRIGHRENNGLIAVLLDLLCICHGLPGECLTLHVGLLDVGWCVPECALRGILSPRKNFERESRGPAVKVDALLVLVADWALLAGGLHEGAVLLGEDNVLFGVLKNDLWARDQRGRKRWIRVATLSVGQISFSAVRHKHSFHVVGHYLVVVDFNADVRGFGVSKETDIRTHVRSSGGVEVRDHGCAGHRGGCKQCGGHEGRRG